MDRQAHFRSVTDEFRALQDRVRQLIRGRHWQTDGEWKETVLRSILRRHLPQRIAVGRGFVVTEGGPSRQCDVLLFDASKPVLYQEGELVFVTPDAALGIIEVKTRLTARKFGDTIATICGTSELIKRHSAELKFVGLFSYEAGTLALRRALALIKEEVGGKGSREIHAVALGPDGFIRFWNLDPLRPRIADRWHAYRLEHMAPGYFVYNVLEFLCPSSIARHEHLWFPAGGKESCKVAEATLRDE